MARREAQASGGVTSAPQSGLAAGPSADEEQGRRDVAGSDQELIARVSAARRAGADDPAGVVEELLRRAADRNRAALDRLAR